MWPTSGWGSVECTCTGNGPPPPCLFVLSASLLCFVPGMCAPIGKRPQQRMPFADCICVAFFFVPLQMGHLSQVKYSGGGGSHCTTKCELRHLPTAWLRATQLVLALCTYLAHYSCVSSCTRSVKFYRMQTVAPQAFLRHVVHTLTLTLTRTLILCVRNSLSFSLSLSLSLSLSSISRTNDSPFTFQGTTVIRLLNVMDGTVAVMRLPRNGANVSLPVGPKVSQWFCASDSITSRAMPVSNMPSLPLSHVRTSHRRTAPYTRIPAVVPVNQSGYTKSLRGASEADCEAACNTMPVCDGFTYGEWHGIDCWLYSSVLQLKADPHSIWYQKPGIKPIPVVPAPPKPPQPPSPPHPPPPPPPR